MGKTKLLLITHEMSPFLELSQVAELTRKLPQAMQEKGFEIRILMPRFGNINERRNRLHEVIRLSGMNIIIDDNDNPLIIKVASVPSARMQVYFLDNDEYFQRKHVFRDEKDRFFDDNDERMIFTCKGALETIKKLGWTPDVVHCHGWMMGLIPAYIKTLYKDDPTFKNSKVVYSVYGDNFNETLNADFARKATLRGMDQKDTEIFQAGTCDALYKGAVHYADAIVLGDQNVSKEVLDYVKNNSKNYIQHEDMLNFDNYYNLYEEIVSEETISIA